MLNLREAAERGGTSKSSVWRAIKSGRMSATRTPDGGVEIDPSEVDRAFPPKPIQPPRPAGVDAVAIRNAALEVEVRLLREMLEEMRRDRDTWRTQSERLLINPPARAERPRWWNWTLVGREAATSR